MDGAPRRRVTARRRFRLRPGPALFRRLRLREEARPAARSGDVPAKQVRTEGEGARSAAPAPRPGAAAAGEKAEPHRDEPLRLRRSRPPERQNPPPGKMRPPGAGFLGCRPSGAEQPPEETPDTPDWRLAGEVLRTYAIVEGG